MKNNPIDKFNKLEHIISRGKENKQKYLAVEKDIRDFLSGENPDLKLSDIVINNNIGWSTLYKIKAKVEEDLKGTGVSNEIKDLMVNNAIRHWKNKYKEALKIIEHQNNVLSDMFDINEHTPEIHKIKVKQTSGQSVGIAVGVLSDIHLDERVDPFTVSNLNEYNPQIAKHRVEKFFSGLLRLVEIQRHGITIDELLLLNLGDNFSGYIHDELMEDNFLSPVEAMVEAEDMLVSGIEFLKTYGKFKRITVVIMGGNHERTTKRKHISSFYKNNYEYIVANHIKKYYKDDEIVNVIAPKTELFYLDVFDKKIRLLHGDLVRYSGGVGGITIPINKAINQWDKGIRADLTIMGHWHTFFDGGNFLVNGSVIGYNAFAQSIKSKYEPPKQLFFLLDNKRFKTITAPICLGD